MMHWTNRELLPLAFDVCLHTDFSCNEFYACPSSPTSATAIDGRSILKKLNHHLVLPSNLLSQLV